MRQALTMVAVAGLLGACAQGQAATRQVDPLYRLATVQVAPEPRFAAPGEGEITGYSVEIRIRRVAPGGTTIAAPRLTVYPDQRAMVTMAEQISYIETFRSEMRGNEYIADPVVGVTQDRVLLETLIRPIPGADDEVAVGFRVRLSEIERPLETRELTIVPGAPDVTIQLPREEATHAVGVRRVELGTTTLLGLVPAPGGHGELALLARVVPVGVPAPDPDSPEPEDFSAGDGDEVDLRALVERAVATEAGDGHLTLEALVVLGGDLPLGVPLDADAADASTGVSTTLRRLQLFTAPVPGVRLEALLRESYVQDFEVEHGQGGIVSREAVVGTLESGLTASIDEDGRLQLTWVTTPAWQTFETTLGGDSEPVEIELPESSVHGANIRLVEGTRLVPIARLKGGGTAAVRVTFRREPRDGRSAQRRSASQTPATMNR